MRPLFIWCGTASFRRGFVAILGAQGILCRIRRTETRATKSTRRFPAMA
jgi:hypothetical protein